MSSRINQSGIFAAIPSLIADKGRVKGFETIRDIVLANWEQLSGICNAYSLLKLAIESDRHAMFASVSEEKARGAFDRELWERFQEYLQGGVDVVPDQGDYKASDDERPLYDGGDPFAELTEIETKDEPNAEE